MFQLSRIFQRTVASSLKYTPKFLPLKNAFFFAETSRDIEQKMKMQRVKNVENKFKSLSTHFGLNYPSQVSKNYQRPSRIEFTMQSLRECSHRYPEYLLKELSNKKSQFFETIDESFNGFASVENKQSIQFLEFLIVWKLYHHSEEYSQVVTRKIFQMDMDLNEMFRLLQVIVKIDLDNVKNKIMADVETKILSHVVDIEQHEYQSLFKLLNFMRIHNLSPKVNTDIIEKIKKEKQEDDEQGEESQEDSFFKLVESVLIRNMDSIPLPSLVQMVVHYANNIKQNHDDMINILTKAEKRIIQNISFFNHDEIIALAYSYLKVHMMSDKFIEEFVRRVELLYFQISWENKKRIINLSASLPFQKWIYVVSISIFEVLKGKKVVYQSGKQQIDPNQKQVEYQLLPTIYLASSETNLATPELIDKLQAKILENMFNYSAQDIGLIAWLFTITPPSLQPKRQNKNLLYTKLQSIILGGFNKSTFTLKDISMVVWALCNTGGKSNSIYKENADFWNNIENYIQDRIANKKEERLFNSCCQIMWAYGNNKPLSAKTVNLIIDVIFDKQSSKVLEEDMFVFELTTMTSFFYSIKTSLPPSMVEYLEKISIKYFGILIQDMSYIEVMKMLKYTIYNEKNQIKQDKLPMQLWNKVIEQFSFDLDRIEYDSIMGVVGFLIVSPQGQKIDQKVISLVKKLMERKAKLQQLKKTPEVDE